MYLYLSIYVCVYVCTKYIWCCVPSHRDTNKISPKKITFATHKQYTANITNKIARDLILTVSIVDILHTHTEQPIDIVQRKYTRYRKIKCQLRKRKNRRRI